MTPIWEPGEFVHLLEPDGRTFTAAIILTATRDGYSVTTATEKARQVRGSWVRSGWPARIDPRVMAVRADDVVGRGTCSVVDECWTDEELQAELDADGVPRKFSKAVATKAVTKFRFIHRTWHAHADEIIETGRW